MSQQNLIIPETQICFVIDGYMLCNYIVRKNGVVILPKNSKYLKFPIMARLRKAKKKKDLEVEITN